MTTSFAGRTLHLVPLALPTEHLSLVSWLGSALASRTGLLPVQAAPLPLDRAALDSARGQYSSNRLVDSLIAREGHGAGAGEEWTLAITAADLFAPDRDFVFGEATLGGAWALLSIARLDASGASPLLRPRLLVEALHELGHLAGLPHCDHRPCAMAPAALPDDIDRKDPAFCDGCLARLDRAAAEPAQHPRSSTLDR